NSPDALVAGRVKEAALRRVFGFEIMPAPFVVAHLQLGLLLQRLGAPIDEDQERVGVYLTNALTGWNPADPRKKTPSLDEMRDELTLQRKVKQGAPILVVIGNPPYDGFAGIKADEDKGLVNPYRTTTHAPRPDGQGLNDPYIQFFRIAERVVTGPSPGHGIVC